MMDEPKYMAVSKTEILSPSEIQQILKRMDWTCSKNVSEKGQLRKYLKVNRKEVEVWADLE
jgi:hypothetical protein